MKKLALTIAIVLGLGITTFAENGGGLFQRGGTASQNTEALGIRDGNPGLPGHGEDDNQNAPLGSGVVALLGFGAAYAMSKRKKEN